MFERGKIGKKSREELSGSEGEEEIGGFFSKRSRRSTRPRARQQDEEEKKPDSARAASARVPRLDLTPLKTPEPHENLVTETTVRENEDLNKEWEDRLREANQNKERGAGNKKRSDDSSSLSSTSPRQKRRRFLRNLV